MCTSFMTSMCKIIAGSKKGIEKKWLDLEIAQICICQALFNLLLVLNTLMNVVMYLFCCPKRCNSSPVDTGIGWLDWFIIKLEIVQVHVLI